MKIVVMGSGGLGGYFGFLLARAGNEVHFIARGERLDAMRKNGLRLITSDVDSTTTKKK
jgi:2-dehydropantoate 2-reductase